MNELSNEELVSRIGDALIEAQENSDQNSLSDEMQVFFDVYVFDMEIGSGASYEQYFRWTDKDGLDRIVRQLTSVGLGGLIQATQDAINIAFPNGIPSDPDEYEDCLELTEEQDDKLTELYESDEDFHVLVEEKLADYARQYDLLDQC